MRRIAGWSIAALLLLAACGGGSGGGAGKTTGVTTGTTGPSPKARTSVSTPTTEVSSATTVAAGKTTCITLPPGTKVPAGASLPCVTPP